MRKRASAIGIVFFTLLSHPAVSLAQVASPPSDWAAVKSVPSGDELVVKLMDGKTLRGRVRAVSDANLTLVRKGQATQLERKDVYRIHRVVPKSAAKPTLIGAGVGAGLALALVGAMAAADETGGSEGELAAAAAGVAVLAAGAGALIGLAFGSKEKKILIYESRQ